MDLLRGVEHRGEDVQSTGGLEGREMDHAVVWRTSFGVRGDVDSELAKLIDEREPGFPGHRPTLLG
jgi:hypothetical protein